MAKIVIEVPDRDVKQRLEIFRGYLDCVRAEYKISVDNNGEDVQPLDPDGENWLPVSIYTDGDCSGNPGSGGWAFVVVRSGEAVLSKSGVHAGGSTTGQRMEMQAIVEGLKAGVEMGASVIRVYSDSAIVVNAMNRWLRNGFRTSGRPDAANNELWLEIKDLVGERDVRFIQVEENKRNEFNELAGRLARKAMKTAS